MNKVPRVCMMVLMVVALTGSAGSQTKEAPCSPGDVQNSVEAFQLNAAKVRIEVLTRTVNDLEARLAKQKTDGTNTERLLVDQTKDAANVSAALAVANAKITELQTRVEVLAKERDNSIKSDKKGRGWASAFRRIFGVKNK